jgi:hypothetical protein
MTKYTLEERLERLRSIGVLYDPEDEESLSKYSWFIMCDGYAMARGIYAGEPEKVLMHRVLMGVSSDRKATVDHINRNRADNRKENLRLVTRSENAINTDRSDKATYITKCEYGYRVQIRRDGKVFSRRTRTISEAQAWRDGFISGEIKTDGWEAPKYHLRQKKNEKCEDRTLTTNLSVLGSDQ